MKLSLVLLIGFVLSVVVQALLPIWWLFAIILFILLFIGNIDSPYQAFFTGFGIVFFTWFILYVLKDIPNNGLLSNKIADLFGVGSNIVLFILVSLVMGIVGGLCAVSGHSLRKALQ